MDFSEETKAVKDILQNLIKAKKTLKMYPQNNPVYLKTLEDSYEKFRSFFEYKDDLTLKIKQNTISYDSEQVYSNPEREDNLALLFFKDGLRELTFKKGLKKEELEEFLRIISLDFDREILDDDIVTLLWEKDFQNIHHVVDEASLFDDEYYETKAESAVKERSTEIDELVKASEDELAGDEIKEIALMQLTEKDLQMLVNEIEKDSSDKIEKLVDFLFEIFNNAEGKDEFEDSVIFMKDVIRFSMKLGDLDSVLNIMTMAKDILENPASTEEMRKYINRALVYAGTEEILNLLAEFLDSGAEVDKEVFNKYIEFLDKNVISQFIKILAELKTMNARKLVIDALVLIGGKDIQMIARGLNDHRWYVVRNIIYILRKIGDKSAVEHLLKAVKHSDIRVRKEAIRALGELGRREVLLTLRECLDDPDIQVRIASARALGNNGSEAAKKILLEKISDKMFMKKDFAEKKRFFEVLSRWRDDDLFDFLIKTLKKRSFFNKSKNYENKACAAYCLGLIGNKEALPILEKEKNSNNKLLSEHAYLTIKRLESGQ
ncbi:MAG: HEAT repeat domain-containing protein [Nitrospirota bacterium]